jgi:hypothetical protein
VPYSPSPRLERLAERLIPPACAEHVLGDLAEASSSRAAYVRNLISVLPHVIWSQVRRRVTVIGMLCYAMMTAALLTAFVNARSVSHEPTLLLRVAVPGVIWVIGRALAAAYGPPDKRARSNRTLSVATTVTAVAAAAATSLPVVRVVMALGAVYVTGVLLSRPWIPQPPPLSPETLADHARLFQKRIWWRNLVESVAGVVVLVANARDLWYAQSNMSRLAPVLMIAGVVFVIGFLYLAAGARPVPPDATLSAMLRFHRCELARQRDILQRVLWWYLLPFVPGILAIAVSHRPPSAGAIVGLLLFVGSIFSLVWRLNLRAARLLDGEVYKVDALEGQL